MRPLQVLLVAICVISSARAQVYTESVLYNFGSTFADGYNPLGGLVIDSKGNLYGTTSQGGGYCEPGGCGTVFKISSAGKKTILHAFGSVANDGSYPNASLSIDKSGNLYGTTPSGGLGNGTVFKITTAGKYSILHQFGRLAGDGLTPYGAPLTLDSSGNLYGTTFTGGNTTGVCGPEEGGTGCGTIFKITPTGKETILYAFTPQDSAAYPEFGNLVRDGKGNFFGVANEVLFELTSTGKLQTLYSLSTINPNSLTADGYFARNAQGNFYGPFNLSCDTLPCTGIWEVTNEGVETTYYFGSVDLTSGFNLSGPVLFSGGNLYGTATDGGGSLCGAVFEFAPNTGTETLTYSFGCIPDGEFPTGGIIADSKGNFYGTTSAGGTFDIGTVFKLTKN